MSAVLKVRDENGNIINIPVIIGPRGPQGPRGDKGDKGDRGDSGVTTPVNGFFTMSVDENGNLYVHTTDGAEPAMEYDETTGNLYFVTEDN